jgi:uncharacterized membrane protein
MAVYLCRGKSSNLVIMLSFILQLAAILGIPFLVNRLEKRSRLIQWVSPIIICYLIGIGAGNIPGLYIHHGLMETASGLSVLLAIPLLLFSANFYHLIKQVRPALLAFSLGVAGVIACTLIAYWIFRDRVPEPSAVAGMMIGVYTGGTPNMSAIGIALGVEEEAFVLLNSADIVFSGIYFIFLMTAGKHILGRILPEFDMKRIQNADQGNEQPVAGGRCSIKGFLIGIGLALVVLAISAGLSTLIIRDWSMERAVPLIILGITTFGIGASFHTRIRKLPHTYETANYLLLVFAVAMGSMADFTELIASSSGLFLFCGTVVFGSALIQILLAFIFRIDRDTMIIASTAAIFGPAFIGPVASAIGNREIIGIGIALGLIGYAIGNYLGLGVAFILQ